MHRSRLLGEPRSQAIAHDQSAAVVCLDEHERELVTSVAKRGVHFADRVGEDLTDLAQFRSTFNAGVANPSYAAYLDADGNGVVDLTDLGQFRSRFNLNP